MVRKILNALVYVLIGVILAECVAFYFPVNKPQVSLPEVKSPIVSPSVSIPTPIAERLAFNNETLDQLRGFYKSSNLKSELRLEDEGTVQSIGNAGKSITGWAYEHVIYVGQNENRDDQIAIAFNKKHMAIAQFVKLEGAKEQPITIADLKKGDKIRWITTIDITLPWEEAIKSYKIIKL